MNDSGTPPGDKPDPPLFKSLRRRRRSGDRPPYGIIAVLLVAAAFAGAAWFFLGGPPTAEPVAEPPEADEPVASDPTSRRPTPPPLDLPELGESDPLVREMVGALSAHPRLAEWLVTDELANRFVTAVVNIAVGGSPAPQLDFMAPGGSFQVDSAGARLLVDPASYARYDVIVDAFASLETEEAARLYVQMLPLFEEAYAELGMPERSFEGMLAVAVGNLLAVDVPEGPLEVEAAEAVYAYRDPGLEALTPAEKHLLRLGPDNARRVQRKLRELSFAIGLTPGEGGGG